MNDLEFCRPIWNEFDGELFQDLVCDLLTAENYLVEPSGVGPDGGIDAFAEQKLCFGYNNPESFVWGVQCKFSAGPTKTICPADVGSILNIVSDERFKAKCISGYFLVTNCRLSTNMMGELRGLNNRLPGFRTTYWDRSRIHGVLAKHFGVYKKYFVPNKSKTRDVSDGDIREFEQLITNPNTKEVELLAFFEAHPSFLWVPLGKDARLLSEVKLRPTDGPSLTPDFILSPGGHDRPMLIELKSPRVKLVAGSSGRRRFSDDFYRSVAQLRTYGDALQAPRQREMLKHNYGVDVFLPRLMVVIGLDYGTLKKEEVIELKAGFPDIEIVTYTELLERTKNGRGI